MKSFQHAIVDQMDVLRRDSLIVIRIVAEQHLAVQPLLRGIILDGNKIRQNLLADFLRESLPFGDIFLPESLEAMAQNFVKENRRGPAGKHSRPGIRIDERRAIESFEFRDQHLIFSNTALSSGASFGSIQSKFAKRLMSMPSGALLCTKSSRR